MFITCNLCDLFNNHLLTNKDILSNYKRSYISDYTLQYILKEFESQYILEQLLDNRRTKLSENIYLGRDSVVYEIGKYTLYSNDEIAFNIEDLEKIISIYLLQQC